MPTFTSFIAGKVMGNTVWLGTFHRETEWNRTHVDKVKVSDELPSRQQHEYVLEVFSIFIILGSI